MEPVEYLTIFLNKMLIWEKWYSEKQRIPEDKLSKENTHQVRTESRLRLEPILRAGLTADAYDSLGEAKLAGMGTGRPPIYEQTVEQKYEKKNGKAFVYTTGRQFPGFRIRYTLVFHEGDWKIAAIHSALQDGPWVKSHSI